MEKWSLTWQLYSIFDKKGQKKEQAFATYGIVGFMNPTMPDGIARFRHLRDPTMP